MMAAAVSDFSSWLGKKLQDLNTDENIFGSYIMGILEGDESREEKIEALEGIFSEINESNLSSVCTEIIDMWSSLKQSKPLPDDVVKEDVDIKLARMLESHSLHAPKQKQYTDEEKKIREAILSQYSQMTDDEEEDEYETATTNSKETVMAKNTNALAVQMAEKEKREQAKLESQKKKERDKEEREKQKQAKEEKKEKRKTQKGERKR